MEQALPISGNYKHICVNTLQNFKRVFLENTFLKMAAILLTAVINVSTWNLESILRKYVFTEWRIVFSIATFLHLLFIFLCEKNAKIRFFLFNCRQFPKFASNEKPIRHSMTKGSQIDNMLWICVSDQHREGSDGSRLTPAIWGPVFAELQRPPFFFFFFEKKIV